MNRAEFEKQQKELSQKISTTSKFFLTSKSSKADEMIYSRQIRVFTGLKKRNATLFANQSKQLLINL